LFVLLLAAVGGGAFFYRHDRNAMLIVLCGGLGVLALLFLYGVFVRMARRRRAGPLEQALVRNTAATLRGISEPARRVVLDDLRKKFESGVAKFRAAGKNLYSLPWYLIVGEPGSGKTECIRRCNVGFPPGLQDATQGAGGTINMNWWFTNHAVILDTAGRLVFEELGAGKSSEWDEFLRLLTRARPNAPINGLILVIPADSLITDSADAIERKAQQIALQFDHVQRSLGVRFPVL
jgi:type VI protein secretion system component VasK